MLEERRSIGEIGNNIRYENTWTLVQKDTHYRSTLPWDYKLRMKRARRSSSDFFMFQKYIDFWKHCVNKARGHLYMILCNTGIILSDLSCYWDIYGFGWKDWTEERQIVH